MIEELKSALSSVEVDPNELAYFALTSKPEAQIRDRLAYRLHVQLAGGEHLVAREWRRTDLAVLTSDGLPLALLEAKAFLSPHAVKEPQRSQWQARINADVAKARALARKVDAPQAAVFALVIVTHVLDQVTPDHRHVVKYQRRLRDVTDWKQAQTRLDNGFLESTAPPFVRSFGVGRAFGVGVEISARLYPF